FKCSHDKANRQHHDKEQKESKARPTLQQQLLRRMHSGGAVELKAPALTAG
ncbi:unnamed protein product, partial [Ceratitis capitata]